jgi:catechol 2,3-dioxygenase-like lactoylglutathione lyase family enzyme
MLKALTHVGICVSDLERSLRFYRDALGFTYVSELEVAGEPAATLLGVENVRLKAVYLERDGVRIELLFYGEQRAPTPPEPSGPRPMDAPGFTHLSFQVDDVRDALAALEAAGATVLAETVIEFPGFPGPVAAFLTDPDGTRIELVRGA